MRYPFDELSDLYRKIVGDTNAAHVGGPHSVTAESTDDSTNVQYDARFAALDEELRQRKLTIALLVRKARRFELHMSAEQVTYARSVLDLFKTVSGAPYDLEAVAAYMVKSRNFEIHQIGILIAYAMTPAERVLHFHRSIPSH